MIYPARHTAPPARRLGAALALLAFALLATAAHAQTLRPELPVTNGTVFATALSDDGATLYLGGDFSYVGPYTGSGVRLSPSAGTVLPGGARVNGEVLVSVPDGAGGYYIGGQFTSVGGVARNRLAHVLADGTLDAAFDPSVSGGSVFALAFGGGTLYAGGSFDSVGGQARRNLAAVDAATGAVVTAFDPNASSTVRALALGGDTLYAGGFFTTVNGQTRNRLAAVDAATGALVTAFDPNVGGSFPEVFALALGGGTLYAGGSFESVGGQTRSGLAAVDAATGALVTTFDPNAVGPVFALALGGGTLYAGGNFESVGGQTRRRLAAVSTADGSLVTAFRANVSGEVRALALGGGTLYAGGIFSTISGQTRSGLAAVDAATGALVTAFSANVSVGSFPQVSALALGGSTLYAGGRFESVGGQTRSGLAAVDAATGALVTTFNPDVSVGDGSPTLVFALAIGGGTLYAGGIFTRVGGQTRRGLGAVDAATGALVTAFDPNVSGSFLEVRALALGGGTLYAGGDFTRVGGQTRNNLAAVDAATGALVTAFDPNVSGLNSLVSALVLSGGTLYAGGFFESVGGQARRGLAAVDATTGALVTAFDPNVGGFPDVFALALGGGTLYAGGRFASVGGQARRGLAAVDATTGALVTAFSANVGGGFFPAVSALALGGGTLYAGGNFTIIGGQTRNNLAAVDAATGALVTAFDPDVSGGSLPVVRALALGGGTLYAGGDFTRVGGQPRDNLAGFTVSGGTATDGGPDALAFALAAPAPNPTGGASRLVLTGAGRLRAVLIDVLGREVAVLHDGEAAGPVALTVDGRRLAPGVYTVRATDGTATTARRLTVVR